MEVVALRALVPFDSLVFLCHGNVCRSPFAAAVASARLGARRVGIAVASAGFIGPGREPPVEALAAAMRCGIDLRTHRSQLASALHLTVRPLVLVVRAEQRRVLLAAQPALTGRIFVLGDFDPVSIPSREIADPWGRSAAEFDASYARITRCVFGRVCS